MNSLSFVFCLLTSCSSSTCGFDSILTKFFSLLSHCAVLHHLYYFIIFLALFLFPVRHGSCFRATFFFFLTFVSFSYSASALAQPGSFLSLLLKFSNPCSIIPKLTWCMLFAVYKKITIATGHLLHNLTPRGK